MRHHVRLISLVLAFALVLGLMPVTAYADALTTLNVGGTGVAGGGYWLNNGSGGLTAEGADADNYNVRYDKENAILYLNGAQITTVSRDSSARGIYANGDLTICVESDSKVDISAHTDADYSVNGILVQGRSSSSSANLTILGPGALTVISGSSNANRSYGINVQSTLTVEKGARVAATAGASSTSTSSGVACTGLICAGELTGTGGQAATQSAGISVSGAITMNGGTLNGRGGISTSNKNYYFSYGVLTQKGIAGFGTVNAAGGDCSNGAVSCGYSNISSSSRVEVTGLRLTAVGGTSTSGSYGVYPSVDYIPTGALWLTAEGGTSAIYNGSAYFQAKRPNGSTLPMYERTEEGGAFTSLDEDFRNAHRYGAGTYYELLVDHAHVAGSSYTKVDDTTHSVPCTGDTVYGVTSCPAGYVLTEPHALDENNNCVCDLQTVATFTDTQGAVRYLETAAEIEAAVSASQDAQNVLTLLRNVDLGGDRLDITGGAFTLDLNGREITSASTSGTVYLAFNAGIDLTIRDSSATDTATGTGAIRNTGSGYAFFGGSDNKVTIYGGTFEAAGGSAVDLKSSEGTIHGGTFRSANKSALEISRSRITIHGGSFIGSYGAITYYSGQSDAAGCYIYGGTFEGGQYDLKVGYSTDSQTARNYTLYGGTFPGGLTLEAEFGATTTLSQQLAPLYSYFVGENRLTAYESDLSTGTETVTVQKYVEATVTTEGGETTEYGTLAEAITAAQGAANSTLTLQRDITTPAGDFYAYEIKGGTFTLDLNGKTIDPGTTYGLYIQRATLTITDTSEEQTGGIRAGTAVTVSSYAHVTIQRGTYTGVEVSESLTIEGGSFSGEYAVTIGHYSANLTIKGGTFTGTEDDLYYYIATDYEGTTAISGGTFPGGLQIALTPRYDVTYPTAAQLLASEHNYFEGDSDTVLKATAEDPYTVAGELVTVARKVVIRISLPQEVYDYNGGVATYTFDVTPDATQDSPIPGTIATYFDGQLWWEGSDPIYDGKTGTAAYSDWAAGAHTIQVVFTPEDTTLPQATSNTVTFILEKVQITAENWTQFFNLSNTTQTYGGDGKAVTLASHWNSIDDNRMYVPQENLTVTYWQGDTQVENPTNVGTYTVKFSMVESAYFKPVTDLEVGTLTIEKADPTLEHLDYAVPTGDYYSGQPFAATAAMKSGLTAYGELTVEYLKDGETQRTTTAPVTPGTYTVYACVTGGENFNAGEMELGSFTIIKPWPGMGDGIYLNGVESYNTLYEDEPIISMTLGAAPPSAVPTGTVTILANNEEVGTFEIKDGKVEASLSALDAGTYSFAYIYSGDDIYAGFNRKSYSQLVISPRPVTLEVTGTEQLYDGNAKTITFENNTKNLTTDSFTVTYYLVNENMGTISKVNRAVSTGRYLYVVELKDEFKTNYTFANPITINGDTLPEGTFDNAGFMDIVVGLPEAQEPIYFVEGAVAVYLADGTYAGNTLINPNNTVPTYTSSNPDVAEVAADGTVTLKRTGTVTIFAASEKEGTTPVRASYTLTIGKKDATITVNGLSTTYGEAFTLKAEDLTVTGCTPDDLDLTNLTFTGYTVGQGVGTYYITPAGITSQMYDLTFAAGPLTVQPRAIDASAVTVTAAGKLYDGTTDAGLTAVLPDGAVLSSDKVTVTAQGAYADANAGTTLVNITSVTLEGKDADNYVLTGTAPATTEGKIEQATVTFTTASKTVAYDGTAKALDITARTNNGLTADYTVSYSAEPILPGTYTVSVTLTDTVNYAADTTGLEGKTLTITQATQQTFTITGLDETIRYGDKVTLGTENSEGEVTFEIEGGAAVLEGNVLTATGLGQVTVIATSSMTGYTDKTVSRIFTVHPRILTPSAVALDRTYNGDTAVDVTINLDNIVEGDTVTASATAEMATADAGDKLVYVTNIALDQVSAESGKYVLSDTGLQTRVRIDPVLIDSIGDTEADSKTYDGTVGAVVRILGSEDILDADKNDVTIHGTGSFSDANAQSGKTVTVIAESLSGSKAGNYALAENVTAETQADISPAEVFFDIQQTVFVYDGETKSVTVTAKCGGQSFDSFSVSYDSEERSQVGEYTVTVILDDARNYTGAPAPFTMVIKPDLQDKLIISGMPGIVDYGKQFKLTAYAEAGAVITWTSSDDTVATVDAEGNVTILDVDREVTIMATAALAGHEDQTDYVTFIPVEKQVSFRLSDLNAVFDGTAKSVTVIPSVEGMTDYTVTYTDEEGNAVTPVDAGVYYVEVSATGSKYEGYAAGTMTIRKAQLTGTVAMEGWTYGDIANQPTYTVSTEGITPVYTYSGTGMKDGLPYSAGSYTVTAVFTAKNYETLTVSAEFEIKKASVTVTAADAVRAYGEADPAFTVTYDGFINGDDENVLLVLPVASTDATADADVGTYPITVSGGRAENYDFTYVNGTLTVTPAKETLTIFGGSRNLSVGESVTLQAYIGREEVPVKWSSSDDQIASVDENGLITILKAGDAVITASMDAGNYASATASVTISAQKKTVSLTPKTTVFTFNGQVQAVEFMSVDGFTPVVGQNVHIRYTMSTDASVTTFRDTGTYTVVYEIDDPAYQGSGIMTVQMNPAKADDVERLCPSRQFTDVDEDAWYHEAVDYVVENGLMNGMSTTSFAPDASTSRGMIVTVLYRMEGQPAAGKNQFTDVASGTYYEKAVAWAAENGIVNGYGDATFGPDDPITREQIAAIVYRYAAYKGYDVTAAAELSSFQDVGEISEYAVEPIRWANAKGLITGKPGKLLAPSENATRAEVAAIMMRLCQGAVN